MADDMGRDSNESLFKEIERLEKEKAELERRNRERQLLEQKLKELKGTVTSLRSGDHALSSLPQDCPTGRKSLTSPSRSRRQEEAVENDDGEKDIEAALQESRAQIQFLQSQLHGSPSSARLSRNQRNREAEQTSDESSAEDEGEDVMSLQHKQAIQASRDILVENMIPDDIFNDLISRKILTTADVSRIKERNTREAVNEELLNNLCRRSDRAFHVFVLSLRKTLQEYLANRIDPPHQSRSGKKKRKRQTGEVNISVDCDNVEPAGSTRRGQRVTSASRSTADPAQCTCQQVEEQILLMAKDAFRNIRRRDATPASFEQFRKELQQTNTIIKDSMEIMHTLKILCRHGDLTSVSEGSVVFSVHCLSAAHLRELWDMYTSGALLRLVQRGFVTRTLRKMCRARQIQLKVHIDEEEYLSCLSELETWDQRGDHSDPDKTVPSVRARAEPHTKAKKRRRHEENEVQQPHLKSAHAHTVPRPRQAFQEIATNQAFCPSPPAPSKIVSSCLQKKRTKGRSPLYNLRIRPLPVHRW